MILFNVFVTQTQSESQHAFDALVRERNELRHLLEARSSVCMLLVHTDSAVILVLGLAWTDS